MNPRRLYRSRDRQLAGVAGGMAEYLDLDPTIVRILWILAGLLSVGFALLAYVILAFVIPQSPYAAAGTPASWAGAASADATGWAVPPAAPVYGSGWAAGTPAAPPAPARSATTGLGAGAVVGVVLIVFGSIALADAVLPGWAAGAILGPSVILALGAALLLASIRRRTDEMSAAPAAGPAGDTTETSAVDPGVAATPPDDPARPA